MSDQRDLRKPKTRSRTGSIWRHGEGWGVLPLLIGVVAVISIVALAYLFDQHGEGPMDRPMKRDEATQTPTTPPMKPQ